MSNPPNLTPLADRVLIEKLPPPPIPEMEGGQVLQGGILVNKPVRPKVVEGDGYAVVRVLAIGPLCDWAAVGQKVLIARHHAFFAKEDGAEGTFVKETDIIAIVRDEEPSAV